MFFTGLKAASERLPFLPMRAGPRLRRAASTTPSSGRSRVRTPTASTLVAVPALNAGRRARPPEPRRRARQRDLPRPGPLLRRPVLRWPPTRPSCPCEQIVDTAGLTVDTPVQRLLLNRMMVTGVVETPNGAHFTTCTPDYERDEKFQKHYAAERGRPGRSGPPSRSGSCPATRPPTRPPSLRSPRRQRDERHHPRRGLRRGRGRRVQGRRRDLRLPHGHHADAGRAAGQADLQPRPGDLRRRVALPRRRAAAVREGRRGRGLDPVPPRLRRGRLRQAARDDGRHPDRPARQPEHLRHRRLRPAQAPAARQRAAPRATPSTTARPTGCPSTRRASSSSRSTSSPASGPKRAREAGAAAYNDIHRIVTNLGVFDVERPRRHGAAALGPPRRHRRGGPGGQPASRSRCPTTARSPTTREPSPGS